MFDPENVLISGAAGYVAAHVAEYLKKATWLPVINEKTTGRIRFVVGVIGVTAQVALAVANNDVGNTDVWKVAITGLVQLVITQATAEQTYHRTLKAGA